MNTFVCLLGIDGGGKTTALQYMRDELKLEFESSCWSSFRHMAQVPGISEHKDAGVVLNSLPPKSRAAAVTLITTLIYEANIAPRLDSNIPQISECFYYRILAKELIYGVAESWCYDIMRSLPSPALTIAIVNDPQIAYQRKRKPLSRYEYFTTPDDFPNFQTKVWTLSLEEAYSHSEVVEIPNDQGIPELANNIVKVLKANMRWFL